MGLIVTQVSESRFTLTKTPHPAAGKPARNAMRRWCGRKTVMAIKSIISFVGKRELAALGILASAFAAFMAFHLNVWGFIAVSVLFIGYASWTATAFLTTQQNFNRRTVAACAWPVGIAMVQALFCLGLAWLTVWSVRHVFGR